MLKRLQLEWVKIPNGTSKMRISKLQLRKTIRRVLVEAGQRYKMVIEFEEFAKVIKNYQNDFITSFDGVYMTDDQEITVEYGSPDARKYVTRQDTTEMGYELEELLSNHGAVNQVRCVRSGHVIEVGISFVKSETDEEGYSIPSKPYLIPWTKADYDKLAKLL